MKLHRYFTITKILVKIQAINAMTGVFSICSSSRVKWPAHTSMPHYTGCDGQENLVRCGVSNQADLTLHFIFKVCMIMFDPHLKSSVHPKPARLTERLYSVHKSTWCSKFTIFTIKKYLGYFQWKLINTRCFKKQGVCVYWLSSFVDLGWM